MEKKIIYAVTEDGLVKDIAGNVYVHIDHGALFFITVPEWEKYCDKEGIDSDSYSNFSALINPSIPGVNVIIGGHYKVVPDYHV